MRLLIEEQDNGFITLDKINLDKGIILVVNSVQEEVGIVVREDYEEGEYIVRCLNQSFMKGNAFVNIIEEEVTDDLTMISNLLSDEKFRNDKFYYFENYLDALKFIIELNFEEW